MRQLIFLLWLGQFAGCHSKNSSWVNDKPLPPFSEGDTLVVATTNSPHSYYEGPSGDKEGFEYELVKTFAESLGAKVRFEVKENIAEVLSLTAAGSVHMAAAGLTRTVNRADAFHFGPVYQDTDTYIVCDRAFELKSIHDLKLPLTVTAESSYVEYLNSVADPKPTWSVSQNTTEEILAEISEGKKGCTISESNALALHQSYLPNVHPVLQLKLESQLSWMFFENEEALAERAKGWFDNFSQTQDYRILVDKYYGHQVEADAYDIRHFVERIETRLPKLKDHFEAAAKEFDFDWKFLAAVAYQESHWARKSKSYTGVRGIMMLTQNTAKALGVTNRLDPAQSIEGGSRYLRQLIDRLPEYIPEEERVWMALAAYNMGYNHLRDARMLAVWRELNPNRWTDVEAVLPLLANKSFYKKLPSGAARGGEALSYVRKVRNYFRILDGRTEQPSH